MYFPRSGCVHTLLTLYVYATGLGRPTDEGTNVRRNLSAAVFKQSTPMWKERSRSVPVKDLYLYTDGIVRRVTHLLPVRRPPRHRSLLRSLSLRLTPSKKASQNTSWQKKLSKKSTNMTSSRHLLSHHFPSLHTVTTSRHAVACPHTVHTFSVNSSSLRLLWQNWKILLALLECKPRLSIPTVHAYVSSYHHHDHHIGILSIHVKKRFFYVKKRFFYFFLLLPLFTFFNVFANVFLFCFYFLV